MIPRETIKMAGFGRFKLTDALPVEASQAEPEQHPGGFTSGRAKGKGKAKGKSAGAKGKPAASGGLAAEQMREARESSQAKNAEGSARDRMVDIGRGNQQAGRQRAK
jgi:hypothetical protein